MPDQHGFGDNGTESTRPRQSGQGDDQMNEYDSEVAHSGNGINTSKTTALRPIWQFAIDKCHRSLLSPRFQLAIGSVSGLVRFRRMPGLKSWDHYRQYCICGAIEFNWKQEK